MRMYLPTLLPENVRARKEVGPEGSYYIFEHTELGELGAIVIKGVEGNKTQIYALPYPEQDALSHEREIFFKSFAQDFISEFANIMENAPPPPGSGRISEGDNSH